VKRRAFIALLGAATTWPLAVRWPLAAHAQQAVPVIGFLHIACRSKDHQFARG
jgi:hypothetical protein